MRTTIRRIGAAAATAVVAGAFIASPAGAAANESYVGSATGTALNLDVLGQKMTLGFSKGKVASTLEALAEGAGQLLPAGNATTSKASVTGTPNGTQEQKDQCGPISTPAALDQIGLKLSTACSSSLSQIVNGAPHVLSEGSVADFDLSANLILDKVPQLNETIDQVQSALTPVLGQLDAVTSQLGISTSDTVGTLIDQLQATQTLKVSVGKTVSDVSTVANAVTSKATAAGAEVDLLPVGAVVNGVSAPLVSIIVGSAKATSTYDRQAGTSNASFDPAIVRVVTNLAGALKQEIAVAPGQSIKLLEGTPLESEIIVGNGSTVKNADGSVGAIADGVSLHLLKGVNGGVNLDLAHAEAGVAGSPAVLDNVETPRAAPELPRTGGPGPWLPVAGATFIVAAVLTRRFVLRTR
jgi:hypothetical protein